MVWLDFTGRTDKHINSKTLFSGQEICYKDDAYHHFYQSQIFSKQKPNIIMKAAPLFNIRAKASHNLISSNLNLI